MRIHEVTAEHASVLSTLAAERAAAEAALDAARRAQREAIEDIYTHGGYTLHAIAPHAGLGYQTIHAIVRDVRARREAAAA
ncbi:hypothetical protein [Cellulomonas soli]|uniref:Uncharacterized protein n=1 Tax=Cellulomonas soli TaxID=931535 RepID=A0A512PHG2_9CELL|nr:hypothetical protein [Cellulomonas soli]NYI59157.1 hypothetical protein [Cellulomonas soli]GEP70661.1 hypothetical protein CSO01_33760 [Cellulomonas soli]